jgi:hypothetical protein
MTSCHVVARQSPAVPGSGTTSFSKHGRPVSRAQLAAAMTSCHVVARQSLPCPGLVPPRSPNTADPHHERSSPQPRLHVITPKVTAPLATAESIPPTRLSRRLLGSNWYPLQNGYETRDCRATTRQQLVPAAKMVLDADCRATNAHFRTVK